MEGIQTYRIFISSLKRRHFKIFAAIKSVCVCLLTFVILYAIIVAINSHYYSLLFVTISAFLGNENRRERKSQKEDSERISFLVCLLLFFSPTPSLTTVNAATIFISKIDLNGKVQKELFS